MGFSHLYLLGLFMFYKLLFLSLLFFSGCSTSSLYLDKNEKLTFNFNNHTYKLNSKVTKKEFLNYKELFVQRYITNFKNEILFMEYAYTSLDYEFNFSMLNTLLYVFDSNSYEEVYNSNNLTLLQIKLKDKYINVLLQSNDTQELKIIYGFSNKTFLNLAKKLNSIKKTKNSIKPLKKEVITLKQTSKPLTKWSDRLVHFTPLITPLRVMQIP
jgi:hypothetical protein